MMAGDAMYTPPSGSGMNQYMVGVNVRGAATHCSAPQYQIPYMPCYPYSHTAAVQQ